MIVNRPASLYGLRIPLPGFPHFLFLLLDKFLGNPAQ